MASVACAGRAAVTWRVGAAPIGAGLGGGDSLTRATPTDAVPPQECGRGWRAHSRGHTSEGQDAGGSGLGSGCTRAGLNARKVRNRRMQEKLGVGRVSQCATRGLLLGEVQPRSWYLQKKVAP